MAVDDARVIEGVGNDGVALIEERFEQTAVRIETGGVEDRIVGAQKAAHALLKLPVHALRAADETHRGHAVALGVEGSSAASRTAG